MPEFARVTYGHTPNNPARPIHSRLECPCGVSNPAMLWATDRHGAPLRLPTAVFFRTCQRCSRIITADGAVIGRSMYDQEAVS